MLRKTDRLINQGPDLQNTLYTYLMTILRLSYDGVKVTIDIRRTSNLQNVLRRTQGFLKYDSLAKLQDRLR